VSRARRSPVAIAAMAGVLGLAAATAAPAYAQAVSSQPPQILTESFAQPLDGWRPGPGLSARTRPGGGGGAPSLRLLPGGPGRRTLTLLTPLPGERRAVSLDVKLQRRSALTIRLGPGRSSAIRFSRASDASWLVRGRRVRARVPAVRDWGRGGWRHVAITTAGSSPLVAVDGRRLRPSLAADGALRMELSAGRAEVAGLVATPGRDARALLAHRLAEIHARTRGGRWPLGTGRDGIVRYDTGWTTGFWPGALWRAADLSTRGDLFRRWARAATARHLRVQQTLTHDLGFLYMHSSVAAYERLCRPPAAGDADLCQRFHASARSAADGLLTLARSNQPAGMIPTRLSGSCARCAPEEADTIIDSMMNLRLLDWASADSGGAEYRSVAKRHSDRVEDLLVRPDGSTAQSVHVLRSDGTVLGVHTHQGHADWSTWARGQSWGLYGFAETGAVLGDVAALKTAERLAAFVADNLPSSGVPRYDYDAPRSAPKDVSAGVIAAAGLYRLDDACRRLGGCSQPARWRPLADRLLAAAMGEVSRRRQLGFLGSQVYNEGGRSRWDDNGELIFGLDYALEAIALSIGRPPT
jgi:unsaturated chondroitin disaccharide hydrolase